MTLSTMETEGTIVKALSGFYYVDTGENVITCRGRGRLRRDGQSPLVGDRAKVTLIDDETGRLDGVLPRRSEFARPPVANIELLVIIISAVNPIADTFLVDQVAALAAHKGVGSVICINKSDEDRGDELRSIYERTAMPVINTSAVTGEGIDELLSLMGTKLCAFTGNSGVGKSSLLNRISPEFTIKTGDVSDKLGRGRHTTRHTELYRLPSGALVADTPGFSSFDLESMEYIKKEELANAFPEFAPHIGSCRYVSCTHTKERGCAVLDAVKAGMISESRHRSYLLLYDKAKDLHEWDYKTK